MKCEVVDLVKNLLTIKAENLDNLVISWFGGEPLLASRQVLDISMFAKELAQRHSINYQSSMTTNGSLLSADTFTKLISSGVSTFQISLDGPEFMHDESRIYENGTGSYKQIYSNLLKARDSDENFKICLRLHYKPESYEQLMPWLESMSKDFSDDSRFIFMPHCIGRYGGENDEEITVITRENKKIIEEKFAQVLNCDFETTETNSDYICYAANLNSFVIRSNGRIAKCTLAFDAEYNNIGYLDESGLVVDNDKLFNWVQGCFTGNRQDLSCPNANLSAINNKNIPIQNL